MNKNTIITIDGPAASGKSSLAQQLAKKNSYLHINSGLIYRAITCLILHKNLNYNDNQAINQLLKTIKINYTENSILINNIDFGYNLYTIETSEILSEISKKIEIREKINNIQRSLAVNKNIVVDGRDTGTIVFPNANLKIFLKADINTRANRRYLELTAKGIKITKEEIIKDLELRDKNDTNRQIAPLKKANDAVIIDNTNLSISEQIQIIKKLLEK